MGTQTIGFGTTETIALSGKRSTLEPQKRSRFRENDRPWNYKNDRAFGKTIGFGTTETIELSGKRSALELEDL